MREDGKSETVEDVIRAEAYAIYKTRLKYGIQGTAVGDWLQAEDKIVHKLHDDILSFAAKEYLKNDS